MLLLTPKLVDTITAAPAAIFYYASQQCFLDMWTGCLVELQLGAR